MILFTAKPEFRTRRRLAAVVIILMLAGAGLLVVRARSLSGEKQIGGKFPEELVHVRAKDDIVNGGAVFVPLKESAKPIAVIWVHGWGVNFYQPTYINIGRALAERGYTCINANTRLHDLGNVAAWRGNKRVRGGGYWGVASEEVRDLAAWVDFAEARGFDRVVLVGHSAGWSAVRRYQAEKQDPRVVGVVLASGSVFADTRPTDPDQLAQATRLMADGKGEDLIRDPKSSFPSFVSAATFVDIANTPSQYKDFFGFREKSPGVKRIRCPLLAFFGTNEREVGTERDLEQLKAALWRLPEGPSRVETVMIQGADHMYRGEEAQVADTIAKWADKLLPPEPPSQTNAVVAAR